MQERKKEKKKKTKKETSPQKYPARTDWDGGSRSVQLKKAARTRSQTFLQLQAPGAASRRAGPPPALALGRGSAGEPLAEAGRLGLLLFLRRAMKWGFHGPASAQKCLAFSVYVPWTGCAEGRKSLRNLPERETERSSPPVGSPPLLYALSAQSLLCAPAVEQFYNKCLCVSFWVGGEGAGVSANSQAFETLGLLSLARVHNF